MGHPHHIESHYGDKYIEADTTNVIRKYASRYPETAALVFRISKIFKDKERADAEIIHLIDLGHFNMVKKLPYAMRSTNKVVEHTINAECLDKINMADKDIIIRMLKSEADPDRMRKLIKYL